MFEPDATVRRPSPKGLSQRSRSQPNDAWRAYDDWAAKIIAKTGKPPTLDMYRAFKARPHKCHLSLGIRPCNYEHLQGRTILIRVGQVHDRQPMHIGLIVGIGPAATDYYYRSLMSASARVGQPLALTMVHADLQTLLRNQSEDNIDAQVEIYLDLARQLQRAGSEQMAITSIAGHFCVDAFKAVSPISVIDLLDAVRLEVKRRRLRKVGLLGTRRVMESKFYGVLDGVDVVAPVELSEVHDAYVAMAAAGITLPQHCAVFLEAGRALTQLQGCESVLLAGTDLALVFREDNDCGFHTVDCAAVHVAAIAKIANS